MIDQLQNPKDIRVSFVKILLNTAIWVTCAGFLNRLCWPDFFHTKDTYMQCKDFKTANDPVKLNTH